ncbi:putative hexosyltransferase [Rosa chinensis]|uniref:Putative hexosyltransferase n=1 Tax=Rosa chinensis TaxID=74649 RepID=A0A2P6PAX8_ROSCH|nr:scopoletin glucosyltransferase [Rosa chinensis]PRQ19074.1 putative hexosyltransferase [Rosa chinensis]
MANEIWIIPFFGQGHLLPLMELCKHLASRNFKAVFVISSNLSSSIPSSLRQYPLVEIAEISEAPPSDPSSPPQEPSSQPHHRHHGQMAVGLENLLSTRNESPDSVRPLCAVLDNMMSWNSEFFQKFEIPVVSFFTSGACSAAMEYALWKAHPIDVKPGETRLLPGLPEEMAVTVSDIKRESRRPPFPVGGGGPPGGPGAGFPPHGPPHGGPGPPRMGPPKAGDQPHWLEEVEQSIGVMINTCDELEHPFIEYVSNKIEKPVWGVGPMLPEQYWKSARSVLHDREVRTNRKSNFTEDEVNQWLDSKPRGSVLYVSFGSEVGPTKEEYEILAEALEASTRPFIWVVQVTAGRPPGPPPGPPGQSQPISEPKEAYFPHGLDTRVGKRGLIIHGWAPQLLILSHPSTGGFLSHCGWNSTVEAIGRGVPFLAWPIRGDQHSDAKLVASYLKVGYLISEDLSETIKKEDITRGIEKLLSDEEMKQRAVKLSAKFEHGFPTSSVAALDAFGDFLRHKNKASSH